MENKIIDNLIGKTIIRAEIRKLKKEDSEFYESYEQEEIEGWDDVPILELETSDGSIFIIEADYGGYTGGSYDEYPRFITIKQKKYGKNGK
jgi:hypothetical protein